MVQILQSPLLVRQCSDSSNDISSLSQPKSWKDLITDEPFTRKDIIHLQDPLNLQVKLRGSAAMIWLSLQFGCANPGQGNRAI